MTKDFENLELKVLESYRVESSLLFSLLFFVDFLVFMLSLWEEVKGKLTEFVIHVIYFNVERQLRS